MSALDWRVHTFAPALQHVARVRCIQVGVGGTGSWVARMMAGIHVARQDAQLAGILIPPYALGPLPWELVLVDPDVGRQAFGRHDVGRYKAQVLADELGWSHGLAYDVHCLPFDPAVLAEDEDTLNLLVGCVDNPAARAALHRALEPPHDYRRHAPVLYIDAGNGRDVGQVLVGTVIEGARLRGLFNAVGLADRLPAPTFLAPDLMGIPDRSLAGLRGNPEDDCAARVLRGEQSITINLHVAAGVVQVLTDLINGHLTYLGLDIDVSAGVRSVPLELSAATLAAKLSGGLHSADDLGLIDHRATSQTTRTAAGQVLVALVDEEAADLGGELIDPLAEEATRAAAATAALGRSRVVVPARATVRGGRRKRRLRGHAADLRRAEAVAGHAQSPSARAQSPQRTQGRGRGARRVGRHPDRPATRAGTSATGDTDEQTA